ncbi:MAG: hypothetical protein A3K04_06070 [Gallionellales bacterium RBG_16_56_9]|nr:MAG: hypothetical protein A3K04_06070 [Gallionellales bacterium RBG_16_56_9]
MKCRRGTVGNHHGQTANISWARGVQSGDRGIILYAEVKAASLGVSKANDGFDQFIVVELLTIAFEFDQ